MCLGQPKVISEQDYYNIFGLLKQDKRGNVSFNTLMTYLNSVTNLSDIDILALLKRYAERNTKFLNSTQFVNMMMIHQNGIDKYDTETCKILFYNYRVNGDGYVDKEDLLKNYLNNALCENADDARNTIRRFDTNYDDNLNNIEFIHFFKINECILLG